MFDLISIGDCRIDNFYHINDAHLKCKLKGNPCELCLKYGDKIVVDRFQQFVAGNNANNAVASARLKLRTAIYGHVGDDVNGRYIIDVLRQEGVDTRYLEKTENMDTENSSVINFGRERTILVFHQPWRYNLPDLESARWVYFSSVSYSFHQSPLVKQLENYLERSGARLAFAPGTHVLNWGVKKLPRLLSLTKILIVNLEEAKKTLGMEPEAKITVKRVLNELIHLGPEMAVVTDGQQGAYGYDGTDYWKIGAFPARVVETTGAGDAFASAVVVALAKGEDFSQALRWGSANAASVIEQYGPLAGLLYLEKMQERLKERPGLNAEKF